MISESVSACIEAAQCVVMTKTRYNLSITSFVIAGLMIALMMFVSAWTPAMIFLKAKMKRHYVFYVTNRAGQGTFVTAKPDMEGTAEVKNSGYYILTENSHTREKKSGVPLFLAFGEFAGTIPMWWVFAINKIKDKFSKTKTPIHNVQDMGAMLGKGWDGRTNTWVKTTKLGENEEIKVTPYVTFRMQDLINMFPWNFTPAMAENKTAHLIAAKQKMWNFMTPQFVLMFIMILIAFVIGAVILWKFMGTGDASGAETAVPGLQVVTSQVSSLSG